MANTGMCLCFISVLVTVNSARSHGRLMLPRMKLRNASIKSFFNHPLKLRNSYESARQWDNIGVRKTASNIRVPIYIITSKYNDEMLPFEKIFSSKHEIKSPYEIFQLKSQENVPLNELALSNSDNKLARKVMKKEKGSLTHDTQSSFGNQNNYQSLNNEELASEEADNQKDILIQKNQKLPYIKIATQYENKSPYDNLMKTLISFYKKDKTLMSPIEKEIKNALLFNGNKLHKHVMKSDNKIERIKENLFDENGMIYLTKPKDAKEDNLNRDMNKLVARSLDLVEKKLPSDYFVPIDSRNVLRLRQESNDKPIRSFKPNTVYEFSELVI